MHRICSILPRATKASISAFSARFASGKEDVKKTDLFGYEVNTDTSKWIAKIKGAKYYDQAGELLVQMNLSNTPPDLGAYNATLQRIHECDEKFESPDAQPAKEKGDKLCAMLDLIEEMEQRSKIKPDAQSWLWVMKECVASGNYRMGYIVEKVWNERFGEATEDKTFTSLLEKNEKNAVQAKESGKEHPAHLKKVTPLFQTVE